MPDRSPLRALFPVEHGLWCWVGAPLLAAAALGRDAATALGVAAVLAGFASSNAVRARAWTVTVGSGAIAIALAAAAAAAAPRPGWWIGAVVLGGSAGAALLWALDPKRRAGRGIGRHTVYELGAIVLTAGLAFGLGAAGGRPEAALAVQLVVVTWELLGLWWVRGELGRVLPERALGRRPLLGGAVVGWGVLAVLEPLLAVLPLAYALRVRTAAPVRSPRDARRIGLSEAAWTAGVAVVAVLLVEA